MLTQSYPTLYDPIDCSLRVTPSMGLSLQEYWSGLPFLPLSGDLPHPGIEPAFLAAPALAGRFFTIEPPEKKPQILDKQMLLNV